jgi:chromosomal replication initiation ATPase DnaA
MTPGDRTRRIINVVAAYYKVPVGDVLGRSRTETVVEARWAAMTAAWVETTLSFPQLGRLFGRDHTSVLHAVQKTGAWPDRRWPKTLTSVKIAVYKGI